MRGVGASGRRRFARTPPWAKGICYKLAYAIGNVIVISILYVLPTSIIYTANGRDPYEDGRSTIVVAWMWISALVSWLAYLVLQGSDPGYITSHHVVGKGPLGSAVSTETASPPAAPVLPFAQPASSAIAPLDRSMPQSASSSAATGAPQSVAEARTSLPVPHRLEEDALQVAAAHPRSDPMQGRQLEVPQSENAFYDVARDAPVGLGRRGGRMSVWVLSEGSDDEVDYTELHPTLTASNPPATAASDTQTVAVNEPAAASALSAELSGVIAAARIHAAAGCRPCPSCPVLQPARAHHCRSCNKCVATFDHHCSMIGTCIGERNRCRFWTFLGAQAFAIAVAIGILNTSLVWRRETGDWVAANIIALTLLVVLWILQALLVGLFGFHSWLALTNTTTFETVMRSHRLWYLAGTRPKDCDLPYSSGICGNLRLFCCVLEARVSSCSTGQSGAGLSSSNWSPYKWAYPGVIDRDSSDILHNVWENQHYSCC